MQLKNSRSKLHISTILKIIILILFMVVIARLAIWENQYYKSQEGKERIEPRTSGDISIDSTDVDETIITNDQKQNYTVAADQPRFLSIEKIGVNNARILPVNETAAGAIAVPLSIFDVGWYTKSSLPGKNGTAILDGHNGGPTMQGVFKNLVLLEKGDHIIIEMGDGTKYTYQVYDNYTYTLKEANQKMRSMQASPVEGVESISIITCTGEWSNLQRTYLSRQFLRAVRI